MKRIAFLLLIITSLTACNNEIIPLEEESEPQQQIQLSVPDAKVMVYSNATVNECYIDSIWVLVFDGTTLVHKEFIKGDKIMGNGQASQLLPQLKIVVPDSRKIICIANSDLAEKDSATINGVTPSTINSKFHLSANEYYEGGDHLPMYGEIGSWSSSSAFTCTMTRAVAKLQVRMGEAVTDMTGQFNVENIYYTVFNGGASGDVQPVTPLAGHPHSASYVFSRDFRLMQKSNATEYETNLYMYDYPSSKKTGNGTSIAYDTAFNAQRAHIILKNALTTTDTVYYRLDFYDKETGKYLDIERNHHYIFTINKVRSQGYSSLDEAQANVGSNIEYDVTMDADSRFMTSNGQYAIVTSMDTAKVAASGASNVTIARAQVYVPSGVTTSVTTNSITASTGLTLNSPSTFAATNTYYPIVVTTTSGFTTGTITFKYGNITHVMYVKAN